jgi:hypothetical protein
MAVRQRRYSKEELARRGQELYESGIRQQVEAGNEGKIGEHFAENNVWAKGAVAIAYALARIAFLKGISEDGK